MKIGISGIGFVGGAMVESFKQKGYTEDVDLFVYDKFKNGGIGLFDNLLKTDILFLALPTPYNKDTKCYDLGPIHENMQILMDSGYSGAVVMKSTVEPLTTQEMSDRYKLQLVHNPEFLTARTAFQDFHNQKHIVLGKSSTCSDEVFGNVQKFYKDNYPQADISVCNCTESESMKLFVNCFYATKVQFFNELYLLSNEIGCNYDTVKNLMLNNGWINPMHTDVPGPDGKLSYGGMCFPKDTNALLEYTKRFNTPNKVISAVIEERNIMRDDNIEK